MFCAFLVKLIFEILTWLPKLYISSFISVCVFLNNSLSTCKPWSFSSCYSTACYLFKYFIKGFFHILFRNLHQVHIIYFWYYCLVVQLYCIFRICCSMVTGFWWRHIVLAIHDYIFVLVSLVRITVFLCVLSLFCQCFLPWIWTLCILAKYCCDGMVGSASTANMWQKETDVG